MRLIFRSAAAVAVLLTATAGSSAQDRCGQFMNGEVEFPFHAAFITGRNFTLEAWVRDTAFPGGNLDLFSRCDPGNTENKCLRIEPDGSLSALYQDILSGDLRTSSGVYPFDQDWHHVALVIDDFNGLASIYVDGVREAQMQLRAGNVGNAVGLPALLGAPGATGWQITELRVSRVPRYTQAWDPPGEGWTADPATILLVGFGEGQGASLVADHSAHGMLGTVRGRVMLGVSGKGGDADHDGIQDQEELALGCLPFDLDSDDDGVSDIDELQSRHTFGRSDPAVADSDGDGLLDGTELGVSLPIPDLASHGIAGTATWRFVPDGDAGATTTDPTDRDSDEDGFEDGEEDLDRDGAVGPDELDASDPDTDGDWLQDGTESGLTSGRPHTDPAVFIPDADPGTVTDPLDPDTDGGSPWDGPMSDGREDLNRNGAYEPLLNELDPLHPADDHFRIDIPMLVSGQPFVIDVMSARPYATIHTLYTRHGWGPSYLLDIGLTIRLDAMWARYDTPIHANANGDAVHFDTLPWIGSGFPVFYQAVESVPGPFGLSYRLSYARSVVVL